MVWLIIIILISLGIFRLVWDKIEDVAFNAWFKGDCSKKCADILELSAQITLVLTTIGIFILVCELLNL